MGTASSVRVILSFGFFEEFGGFVSFRIGALFLALVLANGANQEVDPYAQGDEEGQAGDAEADQEVAEGLKNVNEGLNGIARYTGWLPATNFDGLHRGFRAELDVDGGQGGGFFKVFDVALEDFDLFPRAGELAEDVDGALQVFGVVEQFNQLCFGGLQVTQA